MVVGQLVSSRGFIKTVYGLQRDSPLFVVGILPLSDGFLFLDFTE